MYHTESFSETTQVLSVIEQYHTALTLLDAYDHQTLPKPKGNHATYHLTYSECKAVWNNLDNCSLVRDYSSVFS